jgi:FRG domain
LEEIRVESWLELQEQLYADSWHTDLQRHRSRFAFRGRNDAREDLRTSLMRLGGSARVLEGQLLRNFRKYAARGAVPADSVWNWLALGQHHGLPTRLLDWTYSPYVALHFATGDLAQFARDGVVWMLDYALAHALAPEELRQRLESEGADVFTTEMLASSAPALGALRSLADEPFAVFFEPPSFDDRIVNQYALFSMLSDPALALDSWLAERPDLGRRVVVPAALKWEVRDKLDQANINERVLFPGLDGLSSWLARYYLPRSD